MHSEDSMYVFREIEQDAANRVWSEWALEKLKPASKRGFQKWDVVSKTQLLKVWSDFAHLGFVRSEKAIDNIASQVLFNIAKLSANTTLLGHTSDSVGDYLQSNGIEVEDPEVEVDGFEDFAQDKNGQWILSDRINKLTGYALELIEASTPEEKLMQVDKILNFTHPRSDLAALFVEGGSKTLDELSSK